MSKALFLVSALLIGGAAIGLSGETARAAIPTKSVDASVKVYCGYLATIEFYTGKQRSKFIRQCRASNGLPAIQPLHEAHR